MIFYCDLPGVCQGALIVSLFRVNDIWLLTRKAEAKHSTLKGEMSSLQRALDATRRQVCPSLSLFWSHACLHWLALSRVCVVLWHAPDAQVESDRKQLEDLTRGRDMLQRRMVQVWYHSILH